MSAMVSLAVPFVIYNAFYIVFSIVTITSGILTRFYLSLMYDNNDNINGNLFESFSFTTQCLIVIGVVMILVSLVSCSILINDEIQTILTYLMIMLVVIAAEFYVGLYTLNIPEDIATTNNKTLSEIFGKVTSNGSMRTNDDAISIQLSLQCCGFDKSTYWKDNRKSFMEKHCCKQPYRLNKTNSFENLCDRDSIWQEDCLTKSTDIARRTAVLLCTMIFINAIFKVSGILCFLYKYEWNNFRTITMY